MKKLLKNKWLWAIVILTLASGAYMMTQTNTGEVVAVYRVDEGKVVDYIEDVAEVKSHTQQRVSAESAGKVLILNVDIGDRVEAGQILVVLDKETLAYQYEGLKARQEGLNAYLAELKKPSDKDIKQKMAAVMASAKASYTALKDRYDDHVVLLESGAVSQAQVDEIKNAMDVAYANYLASVNDYELASKGTSENVIAQAQSDLEALAIQLEQVEKELEKTDHVARVSGHVVEKFVSESDFVMQGSPLLVIEDSQDLYLEADLLAEDILSLEVGSRVVVGDEDQGQFEAKVTKIHPKAHSKVSDLGVEQKRVVVEIALEDTGALKLGYEYDIEVVLTQQSGLRIPDSAYFKLDDQGYVFVVEEGLAKLKPVTITLKGVDHYLIEGLAKATPVIKSPSSKLEEGMKVVPEE